MLREPGAGQKSGSHLIPGSIVAVQFISHPHHGYPQWGGIIIILLFRRRSLRQNLVELLAPKLL